MKFITLVSILLSGVQILYAQVLDPDDVTGSDTISFEYSHHLLTTDTSHIGNWQIGIPSKTIINEAFEGYRAMVTDTANTYDTCVSASFQVTVPHGPGGVFEMVFWHWYETTKDKDGGYLEVSYDMGETWVNMRNDTLYTGNGGKDLTNIYPWYAYLYTNEPGFSGHSSNWVKSSVTWFGNYYFKESTYKSDVYDTTLVRFVFISDSITE